MLLENGQRLKADSGVSALVTPSHGHRDTGNCRHCGKTGHKEDLCWKKYPELIPDRYKSEEKEAPPTPPNKTLSVSKRLIIQVRSGSLSESRALGRLTSVRSEVASPKWTGIHGELRLRWPDFQDYLVNPKRM